MAVQPVKGNLVTPIGITPSGLLSALALDEDGKLIVTGSVGFMAHNLLDGSVHPDTVLGAAVRGDIIRGNATPKWERLAKGNANEILTSDGNDVLYQTLKALFNATMAGVAFPVGPAAGDIFFRTDIGLLCFYDGTRWLTVNEYNVPLPNISATVSSSSGQNKIRKDYTCYITKISLRTRVSTTNDAANYWTIIIRGISLDGTATSDIYTFATPLDGVSIYVARDVPPDTALPANQHSLYWQYTTTLAPGALAMWGMVSYRLIIT